MSSPSQLEKAKGGDAAAIADLINQALRSKGITVRGDRQGDCLRLWLTGQMLPPQAQTVSYVRQGIERLQVANVAVLHIYGEQTDQPKPGWGVEVVLGAPDAEVSPLNLEDLEDLDAEAEIDRDIEAFLAPESAAPGTIDHAYMLLELEPGSSLQAVEGSYFKLKALALREGDRPRVERLKQAFYQLKDHIENPPAKPEPSQAKAAADDEAASLTPVERVQALLKRQRLAAQVNLEGRQLQISWLAVRVVNPEDAAHQVHALLLSQDLAALGLGDVETLVISALSRDRAVTWQQVLPLRGGA
ncbi:hypothetical protein IQ265_13175 [Nodosilinea sp. LEGE 06152]|uniref:hypothetical protein n=1 Tax=Nodosilinea sp. LEGE 06152 TaxID=2777966 RepID=UPI00187F91F0|nr:hypothetical protein [Nodosilinea sp. LEGE 06152]MBE9157768.1 hypothetical protein [Nodosilinea sp. LEGE 06152]